MMSFERREISKESAFSVQPTSFFPELSRVTASNDEWHHANILSKYKFDGHYSLYNVSALYKSDTHTR